MSDDHDDPLLRASAYLDGDLDAAETAQAEADPAVMAEVVRLRALQADLTDVTGVEPPTTHARETALAAALAEFDASHGELPRGEAPTIVPFRPKPAYTKWLGVAAAVVVLGLLGVVLASVSSGGDDSDDAGEAAEFDAAEAVEAPAATEANRQGEQSATALADEEAAPMLAADAASTAAPAATEAPAATATAESTTLAAEAGAVPEAAEGSAAPSFTILSEPIADDTALGQIGRDLLAQRAAGTPAPLPESPCASDPASTLELLAQGSLLESGTTRVVLVAVDRSDDTIVAIDPDSCVIVATGR